MLGTTPVLVESDSLLLRHIELEKVATAAEISWRLKRNVRLDEVDSLRGHVNH